MFVLLKRFSYKLKFNILGRLNCLRITSKSVYTIRDVNKYNDLIKDK